MALGFWPGDVDRMGCSRLIVSICVGKAMHLARYFGDSSPFTQSLPSTPGSSPTHGIVGRSIYCDAVWIGDRGFVRHISSGAHRTVALSRSVELEKGRLFVSSTRNRRPSISRSCLDDAASQSDRRLASFLESDILAAIFVGATFVGYAMIFAALMCEVRRLLRPRLGCSSTTASGMCAWLLWVARDIYPCRLSANCGHW